MYALLPLLLFLGACASSPPPQQAEPQQDESESEFSYANGVQFLVAAKEDWRQKRNCVSCHTNGWGLAAMPAIDRKSKEVDVGRKFAQEYLKKYLDETVMPKGQHGSTEGMVATTAFLLMSDARSGNKMSKVSRQALDHAWKLLDESGTWENWLQCNWPPYESDAKFGPTLMLIAIGEIGSLAEIGDKDRGYVDRLCAYLKKNPPLSLHDKAMRIWAAKHWPGLLGKKSDRATWLTELTQAQNADGGWSMAALAGPAWKRDGGEEQTRTSEAYPTAFACYVLQQLQLAKAFDSAATGRQKAINRGLHWLMNHQQDDGSWFTRSPRRDGKHYISRAATSFALMALAKWRTDPIQYRERP